MPPPSLWEREGFFRGKGTLTLTLFQRERGFETHSQTAFPRCGARETILIIIPHDPFKTNSFCSRTTGTFMSRNGTRNAFAAM
jgi:hypothetical protein